jgi:DNA-binding transcriptional LysR family regulator
MVESWLQKRKITVKDSMELEGLEAISSMVMANLGVSIVPKRCVQNMNPLPVKRLALGAKAPARQLGLAYRDGDPKLTVIKAAEVAFLDAVKIGEFSA